MTQQNLATNLEPGEKLSIPTPRVFFPLTKHARYKGSYGGRGSGKSWDRANAVVERCLMQPGSRIVCIREVQKDLKESAKLLIEDAIERLEVDGFTSAKDQIKAPGDGLVIFRGMQEFNKESIKSLEGFDVAWVEEAQTLTEGSLEMLRPTIRSPGSELWFTWNPRHSSDPVDKLLRGNEKPAGAIVVEANYPDNPFFPAELEEERQHDRRNSPQRYYHIWLGAYEPQAVGAIWNRENINKNRIASYPELTRILVGIDPPKKSDAGANECGIIVAGMGEDRRGYILADGSQVASPETWARKAIALYDLHEADAIVVEVNNGGEMCKQTIHSIRKTVRVIEVTATRGKHVRAEPISALYATDRISHVGAYPELETQMCLTTATGYEGEGSPDRMDAMVWCFTELFPKLTRKSKPKGGRMPTRANSHYNPHRLHR